MDEVDRAQHHNEQHLAMAMAAHRAASRISMVQGSVFYCEDCGEEIPEARRRACPGCVRCRNCQEEAEA